MNAPLRPLADNVVVQAEQVQTQTASGLLLPGSSTEKPAAATVVSVGPDVKNVSVGDKVVYNNSFRGTDVTIGKESYSIIKEEDIVATVE
ncbi:MAG: molecular chaperone GroES, chaperonin GroES [Candidatus Saccharibacteria bacterium]|nr:molecular chaperone GroES, chaperonin GroES [Candidatus Saccharibacteria bacterium]